MKIHRVFSGRGAKPNLELSIGGQSKTGTWRTRKRSCSSYFSKDTGAVEAAFVFRESESCMLFGGGVDETIASMANRDNRRRERI